ncbi:MAG: response regulator [Prolixibacteraceae bacterium]|jgi:CheY-like chemotaxis protein|nr:response regulator [Prolixibacteraceae bacterium]
MPVNKVAVEKSKDLGRFSDISIKYPLTILVVEDNVINQKLITNLFKLLGYKVDLAANGKEAVDVLKGKYYDLIFMDIQMPVMNGYESTKMIIEHWKEERPVIIAITANALAGDRDKCLEAGMVDYITKPINIDALTQIIQYWGDRKIRHEEG